VSAGGVAVDGLRVFFFPSAEESLWALLTPPGPGKTKKKNNNKIKPRASLVH